MDPPGRPQPAIAAPSVPKGGGAIRGIGEKLTTSSSTCTATLTLPVFTTAARGGMSPELVLGYDSGAGNGPFGLGWSIALPAVTVRTDRRLATYGDDDVHRLTGGEDLVPALEPDGAGGWVPDGWSDSTWAVTRFRPRIEGAFTRVERWRSASGEVHWRSTSGDNVTSVYGRDASARVADPADPARVFTWLLQERRDAVGNVMTYDYKAEDTTGVRATDAHERHRMDGRAAVTNRYLKRIRYGVTPVGAPVPFAFEVVLDYGEHDPFVPAPDDDGDWDVRPDPFSSYRAGFEVRTYRRCRRVLMFHHHAELGSGARLVRSTDLEYAGGPVASLLASVTHAGYVAQGDGATLAYERQALPEVRLEYSPLVVDPTLHELDGASVAGLPAGVDGGVAQWADLDGTGMPGVLVADDGGWSFKRNLGSARLGPPEPLTTTPTVGRRSETGGAPALLDLDADGRRQLARLERPLAGWSARRPAVRPRDDDGWSGFAPFPTYPTAPTAAPRRYLLDVTGDGRLDLVDVADRAVEWHASRGTAGFGPPGSTPHGQDPDAVPLVTVGDARSTTLLADLSGDGLTDVVEIRNGHVRYWPNLGHGRFGAAVTMANPPRFDHDDQFVPARLRIGDVDGTGPGDLVYLGRDGITYWPNLCGNGWGEPVRLDSVPPVEDDAGAALVDLLGTGTATLVWRRVSPVGSGVAVRYVDLMAAGKPHLLTAVDNGLGARTTLTYRSSTAFALEDAAAGRPWRHRLPFPVHVVARIEVHDAVSGSTLVSRFAPRDGRYDHDEAEFCGFGTVVQWDADPAGAPGASDDPAPVRTVSWYHTGSTDPETPDGGHPDPAGGAPLSPAVLPGAVSADERRRACRALKGRLLRQETYADDGSPAAAVPYVVIEKQYAVRRVQPATGGTAAGDRPREAVYCADPAETVETAYERNAGDPRRTRQLTLAVDRYGGVTRGASVVHPRRAPALPEQAAATVTVTETSFAHLDTRRDSYRIGAVTSSRVHHLTGTALTGALDDPAARLSAADVGAAFDAAADVAAARSVDELAADRAASAPRRRLLASSATTYWADDLGAPLPAGRVGARGLVHGTRRLAFTTAQVDSVLRPLGVADADLTAAGYIADPGGWWAPSGTAHHDPARFFLPVRLVNPYGAETLLGYDRYATAATSSRDALGNTVSARLDYRTLLPDLVTDANGRSTQTATDGLGRVTALAVLAGPPVAAGAPGAEPGDTIGAPTVRYEYRDGEFRGAGRPVRVVTTARERHADPASPRRTDHAYSDGFARPVMAKVPAERGLAPARGPDGQLVLGANGRPVLRDTTPAPRWAGTGRVVFDHKGNPVRRYEPYFSATPDFETEAELVESGVSPRLRYDPLGRLVAVEKPDGTRTRTELNAWSSRSWDENDTVTGSAWYATRQARPAGDPSRRAATLAAGHDGTPTVARHDPHGRVCRTLHDNGPWGDQEVLLVLDVDGTQRALARADGTRLAETDPDLLGRPLVTRGADAGTVVTLLDVGGNPVRTWTGAAQRLLTSTVYDALRRPVRRTLRAGASTTVTELFTYGENLQDGAARNLRGRLHREFDQAGVVIHDRYDRHGNVLASRRRLARAVRTDPDWSPLDAAAAAGDDAALAAAAEPLLEPGSHATTCAYDALGRTTSCTAADSTQTRWRYDEAGFVRAVDARLRGAATWTAFVTDTTSDARGKLTSASWANGVTTTRSYDAETFRLARITSTRPVPGLPGTTQAVQDVGYVRDAVGNVVEITDAAVRTTFFDNAVVTGSTLYTYDARYQLRTAEGREHAGQAADRPSGPSGPPPGTVPHPNDVQAMRRYTESYAYDDDGNLTEVRHAWRDGGWRRGYDYDPAGNRLVGTTRPADPAGTFGDAYAHDDRGNLAVLPTGPALTWDGRGRLRRVDLGAGTAAYHVYGTDGRRVRTVVERPGGDVEERLYLRGMERYRRRTGADIRTARETALVDAGPVIGRVAVVEATTVLDGVTLATPDTRIRCQLPDHLGCGRIELDEQARVIGYAEYLPFGAVAYRAGTSALEASSGQRGYAGLERDPDTGLDYAGARWYAPWLGRWLSPDPLGIQGWTSTYVFVSNNPVDHVDVGGRYDPAAFADELDGYVDVAERFYLAEDTGLASSLWNTFVATTATVVKGSTSILRVGTGAAAGVQQIENAEDGWDVAIGAARILSDAGEVAGAALGAAGTVTKAVRTVKAARIGSEINQLRAERAAIAGNGAAARNQRRLLSQRIGERAAAKVAAESGLASVGDTRIPNSGGHGVDDVLKSGSAKSKLGSFFDGAGRKPFSKKRTVAVEAKGRAGVPGDVTDTLGSAGGRIQGSPGYNAERLNTAANRGNTAAREAANRVASGATTNESILVVADSTPSGGTVVARLESATPAAVTGATPIAGLGSEIPVVLGTAAAGTAAQGYRNAEEDNLGHDPEINLDIVIVVPGPWREGKRP